MNLKSKHQKRLRVGEWQCLSHAVKNTLILKTALIYGVEANVKPFVPLELCGKITQNR